MTAPPPSDSWTWRKYGQKPIKGSPYPRGYYRCSSSKGCPARKQVERSRLDPEILLVTYYSEHNHNWPSSKTHHHKNGRSAAVIAARNVKTSPLSEEEEKEEEDGEEVEEEEEEEEEEEKPRSFVFNETNEDEAVPENKFSNICEPPAINNIEFGWFSEFDPTSFTMLESPMLAEDRISTDSEMAMVFTMGEEDESLFADLGELPECSTVFRRGLVPVEAEQRRPTMMT